MPNASGPGSTSACSSRRRWRTRRGDLGATPTRLARAFRDTLGIPPHRYVLGRRLDAARGRLLDGQPIADVAAEVGFVDQAHLTRRFRALLGTTPGRFAATTTA